jgi:hypothetical protein
MLTRTQIDPIATGRPLARDTLLRQQTRMLIHPQIDPVAIDRSRAIAPQSPDNAHRC